jgi:hypothetical protein
MRNRRRRGGRRNDNQNQSKPDAANDKISETTAHNTPDLHVIKTPQEPSKSPAKLPVTTKTPDLGGNTDKQGKKGWWQRLLES